MLRRLTYTCVCLLLSVASHAAGSDIVLRSTDVKTIQGNWSIAYDSSAAGGQYIASSDNGWSAASAPLAQPNDYFEIPFDAPANTPFHVWFRLRAAGNSKYNDSIWVQYSDALNSNGAQVYQIGSTGALDVNLERCSGCGDSGWGWQDSAYWLSQATTVSFATAGTHTLRVQIREDGVQIDQIVLSSGTYLYASPGQMTDDTTIVPASGTTTTYSAAATTTRVSGATTMSVAGATTMSSTPYLSSPVSLPGRVEAENFDNGGDGVSYHDTTAGNTGGAYRQTDVDIEGCSEGGYDVGWIAAGEWMNYSVNVTASGSYTVKLRVASPSGGQLHLGFNGSSNVWATVPIPATGGWQNWTTVSVPVSLASGTQLMTLSFDTAGFNLNYVDVGGSTATTTATSASSQGPFLGSPVSLPGRVEAENFDNGADGVSYHDTTAGNAGGAYRQTNADLEGCAEGGYDVGWIAAGEWMNYTVKVTSSGSYTVKLRVASPSGGGQLHLGFNGPSSVWTTVAIPATGGWQNWTTVSVPVSLGAGSQLMTLLFDTAGFNVNYIDVAAGTSTSTTTTTSSSSGGTNVAVVTWNVKNYSGTSHAQGAIDYLVGLNPRPQVIVLNEAFQSLFGTYVSELQARTGQAWQGVFKTHCPPGAWTGSSCSGSEDEGVGVFTSLPIINSSTTLLPYADQWHSARAMVRVALNVGGMTLQVFGTHLQVDQTARYQSMSMIKSYASNYSTPQVVAGDFNADMDQIDTTQGMYPNFIDTWKLVGSGSGYTAFTPSPSMKIDYWFTDAGQRAAPQWTYVVTGAGTFSDHYPVATLFSVK